MKIHEELSFMEIAGVSTTLGLELNINLHPVSRVPALPISLSHWTLAFLHVSASQRHRYAARHTLCSPSISVAHSRGVNW